MDPQKTKNLRVRLHRVKPEELQAFNKNHKTISCSVSTNNDASNSDDIATVNFTVASSFDWQTVMDTIAESPKSILGEDCDIVEMEQDNETEEQNKNKSDMEEKSMECEGGQPCSSTSSNSSSEFGDNEMDVNNSVFDEAEVSVLDDVNPADALSKILDLPPFEPHIRLLQAQFIMKSVVSLMQLSLREDNEINVVIKKSRIIEYSKSKNERTLSPFMVGFW